MNGLALQFALVRSYEGLSGSCLLAVLFLNSRRADKGRGLSGRSAAWLARLVRDQEVEGSNPFAPTIISPLDSTIYAAFSTLVVAWFLRTIRTTSVVSGGGAKPKPVISASSRRNATSSFILL